MKSITLVISFCLVAVSSAEAQMAKPSFLDSASRALIVAINSPTPSARQVFIESNLADDVSAADRASISSLLQDLHDEAGALDVVKVESIGRGRFITVRARDYPRLSLINVAPSRTQSDKLGTIEVLKSWNPKVDSIVWPTTPLANEKAVVALIDKQVQAIADADAFSGVVLVAKGDRVLLQKGYGWANLEDSIRNSPTGSFTIASIGKMFTATAIGQLIAAGKLHFDDTLAKVLPEYPNAERSRQITVRQLLAHTAGLGDLFSDPAFKTNRDRSSPLAIASAVAMSPLRFPPGSRWSYSNEGYVVLGAIIEKVSGEHYDDYLQRHIFAPAGMTHTGSFGADDIVPHRVVGYRHRDNDPLAVRPVYGNRTFVGKASPAGGEYTTTSDLLKFARALNSGRILDAAIRDSLWVGRNPLPWDKTQQYGYGVMVTTAGTHTVLGHGGGGSGSGIDNEFRFFRDGSYTVVVLANMDPPAATDLAPAIVKFLGAQNP